MKDTEMFGLSWAKLKKANCLHYKEFSTTKNLNSLFQSHLALKWPLQKLDQFKNKQTRSHLNRLSLNNKSIISAPNPVKLHNPSLCPSCGALYIA